MPETREMCGTDQFAEVPLSKVPDVYLALVMADALPTKWGQLSEVQRDAIMVERDKRFRAAHPDQYAKPAKPSEPVSPAKPAAPTTPTFDVTELNVDEAEDAIAKVETLETLDAVEAAENLGSQRVGVQKAISKRRQELTSTQDVGNKG